MLGGAVAALCLDKYDPSFTTACIALSGAVIGVIGVYAAKNHTYDDWSKAIAQLQASAIGVVGYFTVIPTSTVEKITLLGGAIVGVLAVFGIANEGAPDPEAPPVAARRRAP